MTGDMIREALDNYVMAVNPCKVCQEHTENGFGEECYMCCFFYGSKFNPKTELNIEVIGGKTK